MGVVLWIVLSVFMAAIFCCFVYMLFVTVLNTPDGRERGIRIFLMLVGATIVLAAQASGSSYADYIVDSVGAIKPLSFGLIGVVVPGSVGAGLAWYLARLGKKNKDDRLGRILALVGTLAAAQFITLVGVSLSADGFDPALVLPNAAFIVAFAICGMLTWKAEDLPFFDGFGGSGSAVGPKSISGRR